VQEIVDAILELGEGTKAMVLAPVVRGRKGIYKREMGAWAARGFVRARVDGDIVLLEEPPDLDRNRKHDIDVVVDRIVVRSEQRGRLTDSVETALGLGEGLVRVVPAGKGSERLYSEHLACPDCGVSLPEMTPRSFSFNSPYGACETCSGLGVSQEFDPDKIVVDPDAPLGGGALAGLGAESSYYRVIFASVLRHYKVKPDTPYRKLPEKVKRVILDGSGRQSITYRFKGDSSSYRFSKPFKGILAIFDRRFRETASESVREDLARYTTSLACSACGGSRLRPESLAVTLGGRTIAEYGSMSVERAREAFDGLTLDPRERAIARQVLKEIRDRLAFLQNVGLGYLTLDRSAASLSGGEGQRIRLATQIGSRLTGVLYVLDEPSVGLHQRDNRRLLDSLEAMRDLGNTVVVVEHDEETIRTADWVVDLGPGAGELGGEVVAQGTPAKIARTKESLTGRYLSGKLRIESPGRKPPGKDRTLVLRGCRLHNLKSVDAHFPLGLFTCVTGVSGSGKSSLVTETLYPALARKLHRAGGTSGPHEAIEGLEAIDKVIDIDQSPIGRTPRSNPATYVGLFSHVRSLFAQVPEARARGYKPGRFSFNVKGGRCESCQGDGLLKIEMHFLPDVYVTCDSCKGRRYNRETLEIFWKGKTIADVLEMTVHQAAALFENVPAVARPLRTLEDVGLGYIRLGQSATTLSGGEAQRVKLSKELARRSTGRTLYVLDEPTTGLHFDDVTKLLAVLLRLRDEGNTVIVIEHNLDVVKTADWIIDLGPEGGDAGGKVVAEGTPEKVARVRKSHTGRYLSRILGRAASRKTTRSPGPPRQRRSGRARASARDATV
jgi:excinuclease ABC subunit A